MQTLPIKHHTPRFATAPQLGPQHMAQLAAQGFKTVVCNRPDYEHGPDQPPSAEVQRAAEAAGMAYFHLPVVSGAMTQEQMQAMAELLRTQAAPLLAFCRSGARSAKLYQLAQQFL